MASSDGPLRRIFISTGEVSGDLQGALLVEALYQQAAARHLPLDIVALGGARMARAGAKLIGDTTAIGSVGIFEALPYVLPTMAIQRRAKQFLADHPPDLAVLIDYMNPNLVMGKYLKRHHPTTPIVYYIAPQQWVWAFSEKDTQQLVQNSDQMLAIFQPEARYFRDRGAQVTWVGHPLVDRFPTPPDPQVARQRLGIAADARIVTLLPASRQQEIKYLLPRIFQAAQLVQQHCPEVSFLVPASSDAFVPILQRALEQYRLQGRVIEAAGSDAIAAADVAITKSGTANLEIALMNVPQVVAYRLNPLSAWIAHRVLNIDLPFISPVNLVEHQPVVPELIQWQATPTAIAEAAVDLLTNDHSRQTMLAGYASMRRALGKPGACRRAADQMLDYLVSPTPPGSFQNA
jgi:lipid-A-disaccharide synthase